MFRPKRDDDLLQPVSGIMLENRRRKRFGLYTIGLKLIQYHNERTINYCFILVDYGDQFIEAANTKCNPIKLPMTVSKMDGYSLYNFSVS